MLALFSREDATSLRYTNNQQRHKMLLVEICECEECCEYVFVCAHTHDDHITFGFYVGIPNQLLYGSTCVIVVVTHLCYTFINLNLNIKRSATGEKMCGYLTRPKKISYKVRLKQDRLL